MCRSWCRNNWEHNASSYAKFGEEIHKECQNSLNDPFLGLLAPPWYSLALVNHQSETRTNTRQYQSLFPKKVSEKEKINLSNLLLPGNHLCDLIFHVTQCWRLQKQENQSRDSWRLFQCKSGPVKCTCTPLIINLPHVVFQSSKSGTQSCRNCLNRVLIE